MTGHDFGFRTDFYTFSPETLAAALAGYEILREVGKGSMGIVYEAKRRADGRRIALKVLPPSLTLTDRTLARFVKEGAVMAKIDHPAIVKVFEHGVDGRLHYFAMEFVDGTTLEQRVAVGPLPVRQAAEIGVALGDALQYAHDHGIVHRDIKPANIILAADGRVAITDFGLARETGAGSFTESGAIVGTPMYMAPEQILGKSDAIDSRADVYGLGATLYELLTGAPPFTAPTAQGVLEAVLERDPSRPSRLRRDLPEAIEAIVLRALQKRPAWRYGSAVELADDLRRFLAGERVQARLPTAFDLSKRIVRRHPTASALLVAVLLLSLGAAWLLHDQRRTRIRGFVEQAELNLTKATARHVRGFRPPTRNERELYLADALRLSSAAVAADPDDPRALYTRAMVHHQRGEWAEALRDLDLVAGRTGPTEELLKYRIDTLHHIGDAAARRKLMDDIAALLGLDRSTGTICIVADYLLRVAAEIPATAAREGVLARVEQMLERVPGEHGPKAIAQAEVLQLRGRTDAAWEAVERACTDFPGEALVHERAARILHRLGDADAARREESMARLLRGEDDAFLHAGPPPAETPATPWDGEALHGWLDNLGRLFAETPPTDSGR